MLHNPHPARAPSLSVAQLYLRLVPAHPGLSVALPPNYAPFQVEGGESGLTLVVRSGRPAAPDASRLLCGASEEWQLWQEPSGGYVFLAGHASGPARQVTVDAAFTSGGVLLELATQRASEVASYPLANLDTVLFANWLANTGDLLLHASGVARDGRGVCFVGPSGAGKSTLAAAFAQHGVSVLGEDNLALRYLEGQFWIFGTPWHDHPARCFPGGVPLRCVYFLDRAGPYGITPCRTAHGVARLLQTAFIPFYRADAVSRILDHVALLAAAVPFYTLSHRLGSDVMPLLDPC